MPLIRQYPLAIVSDLLMDSKSVGILEYIDFNLKIVSNDG